MFEAHDPVAGLINPLASNSALLHQFHQKTDGTGHDVGAVQLVVGHHQQVNPGVDRLFYRSLVTVVLHNRPHVQIIADHYPVKTEASAQDTVNGGLGQGGRIHRVKVGIEGMGGHDHIAQPLTDQITVRFQLVFMPVAGHIHQPQV